MQVNFERAIAQLMKRWEEMTKGEKPFHVEIITYWPNGQDVKCIAYVMCHANDLHEAVTFQNFNGAAKWIASKITAMIENEFYERQKDCKENA